MKEQQIIQHAIVSGQPFTYSGSFSRFKRHPMRFAGNAGERMESHLQVDAATGQLIETQLPNEPWAIDHFGDTLGDSNRFREPPHVWYGPGFRVHRPGYGYVTILFSECKLAA